MTLVNGAAHGACLGIAAWLLSAEAGFVAGQEFVVDGGMSRHMACPA